MTATTGEKGWLRMAAVTAVLTLAATAASAAHVAPTLVSPWQAGNAAFECAAAGTYLYSYKIDGGANGTYTATFDDGHFNDITIANSDGTYFDWSATSPIGLVIVKASNAANLYSYDPQESADTGLHGALNPKNGRPYAVSHLTFCWNPEVDVELAWETAFAFGGGDATCFIADGFSRWGWTNGALAPGSYTWPVYAAAGQCDLTKGTNVGTVTVDYDGTDVEVSVALASPYVLGDTHVYAGADAYPTGNNGSPTVAPGQYTVEGPFAGEDIYVIVHAVVGIPVVP